MKLASVCSSVSNDPKQRHGQLIVVSKDNQQAYRPESKLFTSILDALENWDEVRPKLENIYERLNTGQMREAFRFEPKNCLAPLPHAPGFYDGSAFLSHVVRARRSRGDVMPESAKITPLMYQGVSDNSLQWNAPLSIMDLAFGGDFEGEFAAITTAVPRGTKSSEVQSHIALFCLFNDITYREIVKVEIETKFGFLQSKPNSSYAPLVVTPDELGEHWKSGRINLDLTVKLNGTVFGKPNGLEMHFTFMDLISHACRTRPLSAGSIVGSGTVSNEDKNRGFACLVERRYQEILDTGKPITGWLKPGDTVEMDVLHQEMSLFGKIEQTVVL